MLLLATAIGRAALAALRLDAATGLERSIFGLALGLGALAYGAFALALLGLLSAPLVLALAVGAAWLLRGRMLEIHRDLLLALGATRQFVRHGSMLARGVAAFTALALLAALLVAALPPFAYDALWYHLAAPRLFVQAHRFLALPQIAQSNYPFTVEFLYTLCLLFGSDTAPALLNLALAAATAAATWQLAARWYDRRIAWIAVGALLTASEFRKLAEIPYTDSALTLFELLALYAVLRWIEARRVGWLVVAGSMAGLAAGAKYTALAAVVPLFLLVLFANRRVVANAVPLALFVALTLLVAAPWYAKNLVLYHDAVYPLLAAPYVDPALAAPVVSAPVPAPQRTLADVLLLPLRTLQSGDNLSLTGRGWPDYLALPITVYSRGDVEMFGQPSYLFLLAPFCLLLRRRAVDWRLFAVSAAQAGLWALGPQELRYLLPVFPIAAVLAAAALDGLARRAATPPLRRLWLALPLVACMLLALVVDGYTLAVLHPLSVLAGQESRDAFLRRVDSSYGADAYLAGVVRPGERTLAIGEDRSYYARTPLIIDTSRDAAGRLFTSPNDAATAVLLRQAGVGYLLVNDQDLAFQAQLDPAAVRLERAAFARFAATALTEVYSSQGEHVYRLNPPGPR